MGPRSKKRNYYSLKRKQSLMTTTLRERSEDVNIIDMESAVGKAEELTPSDRMRLSIAIRVLTALAVLICAAGAAMLYGPTERRAGEDDFRVCENDCASQLRRLWWILFPG